MRRRTVSLDVFEPSEIKIAANFMSGKQRKWFHSRTSFFLGGVALFSLSRAPHHANHFGNGIPWHVSKAHSALRDSLLSGY